MPDALAILPFARLLELLRAHGYYAGMDTLVRLGKYWKTLERRKDWDTAMLRHQLSALLCRSDDEQQKFHEIFNAWLPEELTGGAPLPARPKPPPPPQESVKKESPKPPARPLLSPAPPAAAKLAGTTGPVLPLLGFPEDNLRPWNLPGMGQALIPLQEKIWTETKEWDVPATIGRTIRAGGIPQFAFRRRKTAPRYLALIEQQNPRDHLAGFAAELMREINRRDLEAEFYFYEKTPARCWKNIRDVRSHVHLEFLKSEWKGARLLLIGSAANFVNPATGQPSNLALDLPDSWEEIALFSTESPLAWGDEERTLSQLFPVVPLSVSGLSALPGQWNTKQHQPAPHWQRAEPQPVPPDVTPDRHRSRDDVVIDLYRYLGKDAFRWVCATCVYPEIYYELTGILHDEAIPPVADYSEWEQNEVWHNALLRLSRIEWYRRGYLPEPMREDLRQRLTSNEMGTVEMEIRRILDWSENTVKPGTFAASERQQLFGWLAGRLFRVLWIDDHPENNARLEAAWTKNPGAFFRNAKTTAEALTYLTEPFDLIISDIGRADETNAAFALMDALRSRSLPIPVVFYTNKRGLNLQGSLMEQGALEVTNQPGVVRKILEEKIREKFAPPEAQAFESEAPVQQRMESEESGAIPPTTKKIFVSCSEKDERQLQELQIQLGFLEYPAGLAISSSLEIPASENWQAIIRENLENADVIVLLVSRDYLYDERLLEEEIYPALKLHEMGRAIAVPVITESCDWQKSPFGHLNPLPPGGQPVVAFKNIDGAWMSVANGLKKLLDEGNSPSGASNFAVS